MITTKDANGWYNKTYSADSYDDAFNIIISKCTGTPNDPVLDQKSAECKEIVSNNVWIVINDAAEGVSFNVYDVNPDQNPGAAPIAAV